MIGWLLIALAGAAPEPSEHTLIYYNARMALREGEALEAVKLWLLRNALADHTGEVSPHDPDFHSVTWAALGELGICPDGHPTDEGGAGLWPLALHNWVVQNAGRSPPGGKPRPFDAFEVGRQQRFVSIGDVLSAEELAAVRLFRSGCTRPGLILLSMGTPIGAKLSDREVSVGLLRHLLELARTTLSDHVRGQAAIEARLFDVDLQLTALAAREARQRASASASRGRQLGLSSGSVDALRDEAPASTLPPHSRAARILRACVDWPVSEWMALSHERRLFLFDQALAHDGDPDALAQIAAGILDRLIADGAGDQVEAWIARSVAPDDPTTRAVVWGGPRGQRLLALDPASGFDDRAVIALHRGVHHLERGELPDALRSVAYALQHAPESRASDDLQALSRRWMSYIAAQFEITDELLITLQELVPRRDYAIILEDLMWGAAFHADRASFERGVHNQLGRGALQRRAELLQPLADGDVGRFARAIRDGLRDAPGETLRFLDQLVQRLELENADVRSAHLPTLARVRGLVRPLAEDEEAGRSARSADALLQRIQAITEGLEGLDSTASARDRARSLAPGSEIFAGSVRLAPTDPLPWPFRASSVPAPSVFEPIRLIPEEWRDPSGVRIFGWRIVG